MTLSAWHEEAIAKRHDRAGFDCGDVYLNGVFTPGEVYPSLAN